MISKNMRQPLDNHFLACPLCRAKSQSLAAINLHSPQKTVTKLNIVRPHRSAKNQKHVADCDISHSLFENCAHLQCKFCTSTPIHPESSSLANFVDDDSFRKFFALANCHINGRPLPISNANLPTVSTAIPRYHSVAQ
jgi:hypothetical protein